jgi:hypothetical protein
MIICSRNAARLAKAVEQAGYSVCKVLHQNWRISRERTEMLAKNSYTNSRPGGPCCGGSLSHGQQYLLRQELGWQQKPAALRRWWKIPYRRGPADGGEKWESLSFYYF